MSSLRTTPKLVCSPLQLLFLRFPSFRGCKVTVGVRLPAGTARLTHTTPPAARLEDIPPKTVEMDVAELPCTKMLAKKEKKSKKTEAKAAAKSDAHENVKKVAGKKRAGGEGTSRKKKKTRQRTPNINLDFDHISSPTLLNHYKPLEALANEVHISKNASAARLDVLRDHTDEKGPPRHMKTWMNIWQMRVSVMSMVMKMLFVLLFSLRSFPLRLFLRILPFLIHTFMCRTGRHPGPLEKVIPDKEVTLLGGLVAYLSPPQWSLTYSSRIDNSRNFHDMLANLFTSADHEFLNKGVLDRSAINRSWRLLEMKSAIKNERKRWVNFVKYMMRICLRMTNFLTDYNDAMNFKKGFHERVEELEGEKKELEDVNTKQADRIKQKITREYLPTFVLRLHHSVEYKRSLGDVLSLAIAKGWMDDISIDRKEEDIQAILADTPNVDHVAFMERYEVLFDKRYPYVDKVV
ncbi:hypothetical protein Tco_0803062 [Tanacetum coccineum]|uniref:Uncharacterized protein n=1 Tax=Tanacetum coccineum TaxID=301880 RepID=A0ABQ5A0I3_9ASTR